MMTSKFCIFDFFGFGNVGLLVCSYSCIYRLLARSVVLVTVIIAQYYRQYKMMKLLSLLLQVLQFEIGSLRPSLKVIERNQNKRE